MKKLFALTLIAFITFSPVLAARKQVRFADEHEIIEEKPQGRLAQAWETIKEYAVPAAAFAALIFLGWQWKKQRATAPVVEQIRSQEALNAANVRIGPEAANIIPLVPIPIPTQAAIAAAANGAKAGLSSHCVPLAYAHTRLIDPHIIVVVDRRGAQPYYALLSNEGANGRINGQPLRDFFATLDPRVDVSPF